MIGHSLTLVVLLASTVAAQQCVTCHPAQARSQPATSMAHAIELPADCAILKSKPLLTFKSGIYTYRIERKGEQSIYSVSDGQKTFSAPIGWAAGHGYAGQTYIYEKDGQFYQSRVSYYPEIDGLDFTMGALNMKPVNLTEAAGLFMDRPEKLHCFGCHSTDAVQGKQLTLDRLIPGVRCEHCHGPTEHHLAGIKQGNARLAAMKDLRKLSTEEMSNFCGQCHRTWDEVASSDVHGVSNVRFQPYRLTNSKCYDTDDARISCVACHDPHQELDRRDGDYDSKCQACHGGGKASAKPCKVASANCVGCHMPKVEIPGSHHKFTDHEIRIARANAPYPD